MDLNLKGRRALVTGASAGIGLAIAQQLAAEGCRLVLVSRNEASLNEAAATLRAAHGIEVVVAAADLKHDDAAPTLAARFGDVDILVNNAGDIPGGSIAQVDQARWRAGWELKVFGFINMTREFYARMQARRSGVIVNVIGASATGTDARYVAGSTGNAAMEAMTKAIGTASPDFDVRVVGISPGLVLTARLEKILRERAQQNFGDAERWRELLVRQPFGRTATTQEIAALAAFLASDLSGYTSGAIFTVDGGQSQRTDWWG